MADVAAILLAAGLSRRMGAQNKLLLPIDGVPMIRRVAMAYLGAIDTDLTVVTGHEASAVRRALSGLAVSLVHNANFTSGQQSSVATGLHCAPDAHLLLIGLGDQPLLTTQDLQDLIAAHVAGDATKVTIPVHNGARGNPITIPQLLRRRLLENPARPGCLGFTRDHPEHVQAATLPSPGFYTDVDTPDDYATHLETAKEPIS